MSDGSSDMTDILENLRDLWTGPTYEVENLRLQLSLDSSSSSGVFGGVSASAASAV